MEEWGNSPVNWQPEPWMALHPEITPEQWQSFRKQMSPREWEEYCEQWRAYDRARTAPPVYGTPYQNAPGYPYAEYAAPRKAKRSVRAEDVLRATWPCLVFFALSFLLSLVAIAALILPALLRGEAADLSGLYRMSTLMSVAIQVALIPAFVIAFRRDSRKEQEAGVVQKRGAVPFAVLGMVAAVGLYFVVDGLLTFLMEMLPRSIVETYNETMEQTMGGMAGLEWLAFISVVLLAPLMEELMMRGVVQRRLQSIMSKNAALFVAAALFGVLHMNVIQSTYAFLLGLFLGWAYQRSGRLIVPILAHLAFNGMNYVYSAVLSTIEEHPGWLGEGLYRNIVERTPLFLGISALSGALLALLALALFSRRGMTMETEH